MERRKQLCGIVLTLLFCLLSINVFAGTININESFVDLKVGKATTLKVTKKPKGSTIKWCSKNPAVATVTSKGKVKAVGKGEAEIVAYTSDGSEYSSCYVTVKGKKKTEYITVSITGDNWDTYIERICVPRIIYNVFGEFSKYEMEVIYTVKEEYINKLIPEKSNFTLEYKIMSRDYYADIDETNVLCNLKEPIDSQEDYESQKDIFYTSKNIISSNKGIEIMGVDIYSATETTKYNNPYFGRLIFGTDGAYLYFGGSKWGDGRIVVSYPTEYTITRAIGTLCLKK